MPSKQALRRKAAKQRDALFYRNLSVRAETIDAESRSVRTVIATETPVPMMDWERWEMVPEILRADGAILPDQVPFLDNHQRSSVSDQIGSVREMSRDGSDIVGRLHFASDAEREWNMVREGHVTDVSAGYQVLERTFVPKGTTANVKGREYTGPANVVTKWKLREVSLTPIGADEQAKLRGFDAQIPTEPEGFTMNEALRKLLESRGMPKDISDDEAQRWAVENNFGERKVETPDASKLIEDARAAFQKEIGASIAEATRKALEDAEKQRAELEQIKNTLCSIANIARSAELNAKLDACRSREDIEKAIIEYRSAKAGDFPTAPAITAGPAERDKFEQGMRTALVMRCLDTVAPPPSSAGDSEDMVAKRRESARNSVFPVEQRSKLAGQFNNATLYDLARTYVEQIYGVRTLEMSREQVAAAALFGPERASSILGFHVRDAGAYHTTGSFAELTRDAMNKSMMLGYTEAPSTWERVMRRGSSVPDFKNINRLRMGAIPNLPIWPDNSDPQKASLADAREYYSVESRSLEINFSYRLLINDDMDALSRVPGMMGNAARRTVNTVAWSVITANPTMSDGQALFSTVTGNRKRLNLTTGAGAPSTTTLQTLTNLMMQMRGENTPEGNESADILNLMPRYIVGPTALRTTIMQLVMSVYDPANSNMAYNMASELVPVIEPLLDGNSTTAWYLFADPAQIDTVEVSFLQGQESPQVRQFMDERKLSQNWTILQTFGAKAMNHRGIQKHAGA